VLVLNEYDARQAQMIFGSRQKDRGSIKVRDRVPSEVPCR
jgi:hypothetical protein